MLALARLHLLVDDLDACQQQCSQLLEMDKDNDSAFMVKLSCCAYFYSNFIFLDNYIYMSSNMRCRPEISVFILLCFIPDDGRVNVSQA